MHRRLPVIAGQPVLRAHEVLHARRLILLSKNIVLLLVRWLLYSTGTEMQGCVLAEWASARMGLWSCCRRSEDPQREGDCPKWACAAGG